MAYPVFGAAGTIVYVNAVPTTTGINVNYPASISADDILVIALLVKDASTWTVPSGWTNVFDPNPNNRTLMWKRATGGESGTQNVRGASSAFEQMYSVMYRFSGCITTGSPIDGQVSAGATSQTVVIPDLADDTTGPDRLCAAITIFSNDRDGFDNATNYSEEDDQKSTGGSDAAFHLYTYGLASAGKPGSDSYTSTASTFRNVRLIALIPAGVAGYANDVLGVASVNIGKVNGVLTANIAKVNGV